MTPARPGSTVVEPIEGGVAAPSGFRAAGVSCGIKKTGAPDLALVVADDTVPAAAVFTTNRAQAAPVLVSREHLERSGGRARAVVINSGCANACTGPEGVAVARSTADFVASIAGCRADHVLVASTGVIGVQLDLDKLRKGAVAAAAALSRQGGGDAARAIMTTDREPKSAAVSVTTAAGTFRVGGMAKGAGMIEPHMATMLAVVTTDADVQAPILQRALREAVDVTFNAITIDGDTSTNDTVYLLASGASRVRIDAHLYPAFLAALRDVCGQLARAIVRGGEGATKLVSIAATGAASAADAGRAARTMANSLLVKTAIHGGDPNWGRLLAAAGRAGVAFDVDHAAVRVGPVVLFKDGVPFDERAPDAAAYLAGSDIEIEVDLGAGGPHSASIWTCDLSADYVRINAEYRT